MITVGGATANAEVTVKIGIALNELKRLIEQEFDEWPTFDFGKEDEKIRNPEFEKAGNIHDWRGYVPQTFAKHWDRLSDETQLAIYVMAREQAASEVWD